MPVAGKNGEVGWMRGGAYLGTGCEAGLGLAFEAFMFLSAGGAASGVLVGKVEGGWVFLDGCIADGCKCAGRDGAIGEASNCTGGVGIGWVITGELGWGVALYWGLAEGGKCAWGNGQRRVA